MIGEEFIFIRYCYEKKKNPTWYVKYRKIPQTIFHPWKHIILLVCAIFHSIIVPKISYYDTIKFRMYTTRIIHNLKIKFLRISAMVLNHRIVHDPLIIASINVILAMRSCLIFNFTLLIQLIRRKYWIPCTIITKIDTQTIVWSVKPIQKVVSI